MPPLRDERHGMTVHACPPATVLVHITPAVSACMMELITNVLTMDIVAGSSLPPCIAHHA